jgi:hypothetical protein
LHAALDIERGAHPRERQPELHERDGDRRPHADDHRFGIEHARHRGNVAQHPADERIDHLESGDVDQHAPGVGADDLRREVVLQRHRQAVVHVDLDRDEQVAAHLENRDAFHD